MTDQQPRKILAATFTTPDAGARAAGVLAGGVTSAVANTAVVVVQPDGRARASETKDWGKGRGALVGGAVGLLTGPVGMVAGGALGALAAKLRDSGFDDKQLEKLGESLAPGTSAVVVDIAAPALGTAQELLRPLGAVEVVIADVDADVAHLFEE